MVVIDIVENELKNGFMKRIFMTIFCTDYILILYYSTLQDFLQYVFSGWVTKNNLVKSERVSSYLQAFVLMEYIKSKF